MPIHGNDYIEYLHRGNRGRTQEEVAVGRGRGNIVWRPETRKVKQSVVSMEVSRRNRGNVWIIIHGIHPLLDCFTLSSCT